ncbi:MAG: Gfo/Idh/MocA family oxidoreductase [Gemmataceae bacterium]|nr:Gfo/Idh/MocA family oxidoreductase [Gemmataceae bacterium]
MNRRGFLRGASALGAGALLAPAARGANERLAIGIIGTGDRGSALLNQILGLAKAHNVEVTAVCDVWQVNLTRAAARVSKACGREPRRFTRFRELLGLRNVDAVVIATPDFGHAPILIEALKAGKDAYVEKPMALEVAEANQALDMARTGNRIVQAGTQYRSHAGYAAAARELAAGALGQVNRIHAQANFNGARWARSFADCRQADVDWDAYLFNRPRRPFDPRLLRRWHLYKDFTNGLPGLWMSHYVDAVHLLTGARYPAAAVALGGVYVWRDGRQHTDTFHTILEYPEGFLFDWGMGLGNSAGTQFQVFGTRGTLDIGKNYCTPTEMTISGAGGPRGKESPARRLPIGPSQDHMANWLECLRTRRRPAADIQFGHQHAVATIMTAAALETGRRQRYDSRKREVCPG